MRLRFFEIATEQAESSTQGNFRMGALLVRGKNIIRRATNHRVKSHPLKAMMYPTRGSGLHAEVALLRGFRPYDVAGSDVYVVRVLADGARALAKPCDPCANYMRDLGISRVFYSVNDSEFQFFKL